MNLTENPSGNDEMEDDDEQEEDQDDFPEREELWEDEQWDDQDFELDEPEGGEVNLSEDDQNDKFSGFVLHFSFFV